MFSRSAYLVFDSKKITQTIAYAKLNKLYNYIQNLNTIKYGRKTALAHCVGLVFATFLSLFVVHVDCALHCQAYQLDRVCDGVCVCVYVRVCECAVHCLVSPFRIYLK